MADYEVIVIGAGIEGSSTAYQLAKRGKKTLLLEQFPLPHTRGSSHGQSRIARKAYFEAIYSEMMVEAYPMWEQLEKETNTTLYTNTGLLMIGKEGSEAVAKTAAALARVKCKHQLISSAELKNNYPMLKFDDTFVGVLDQEAGVLHADKCLAKFQEMFVRFGGTIHDKEKVTGIHPGNTVVVNTAKGQYSAESIVITAGPWTAQMIKPLGVHIPLEPMRVTVYYWKQKGNPTEHAVGNFPAFIILPSIGKEENGSSMDSYGGLPANEYAQHVKTSSSHGGPAIDPDARDAHPEADWDMEPMKALVRDHFPGLEDEPSIMEQCIYTMTPDEDFYMDTHPAWKNIIIGAGFSGHGFKLSPIVGKILGQLATGEKPSYDMKHFSINRFYKKSKM